MKQADGGASVSSSTFTSLPSTREPNQRAAGGRLVALVVDDDANIRELTARMLQQAGLETLEASDGAEAVRLYQAHCQRIDLVLLDAIMPRMHGLAARDAIRRLNPSAKVVFCSGQSIERGGLSADDRFLSKPFTPTALLRVVRDVLANDAIAS